MRQVLKSNPTKPSALVCLRNQSGQAVVEYTLMLIVTLSFLLALKPLYTNFGKFINDYVGEYTACLMEFGELPSLGVNEEDLKKHTASGGGGKVCDAKFAKFTIADGRTPIGGGTTPGTTKNPGSNGSSNNNGSSSDSSSDSKNSSKSASSSGSKNSGSDKDSNGDKNGSNANADGSSSSSGSYAKGRITRATNGNSGFGTTDGGNAGADDKVKVLDGSVNKDGGGLSDSDFQGSRVSYERTKYKAITGKQEEEIEKQTKPPRAPAAKVLTVADESGRLGPRKSTFTPPERKPDYVEAKEEGFEFGAFMKWLIIAAMVIAIFLFFGGQVMNFTNSQEK